jgi:UDP-glucose 4-epimerase
VLQQLLVEKEVGQIIHMAASCQVGESMREPSAYYWNNLVKSLALLDAAVRHGVRGIVFSSTAAVYGEPEQVPITESQNLLPTNTYGETKLAFERALQWYNQAYGFRYVALRYFNAAGADPDGDIGEDHRPESHLIPLLIASTTESGPEMSLFGTDYPTPDGTCVRDYVHVADLAEAHVLALRALDLEEVGGESLNLGNGAGFSVRQVVEEVATVTGREPRIVEADRRPGDPAELVASSDRARELLGWEPRFPELRQIVETAWEWHRANPEGYADR